MSIGTSVHIIGDVRIEVFDLPEGDFCAQLALGEIRYQALFSPLGQVLMLGGGDMSPNGRSGEKMAEPSEDMLAAIEEAIRERRYQAGLL